jgi:heat shock protein HspQ
MFDYRGVIIDVDEVFKGSEEWYAIVARSRPPKNKPWYHVLVHDSSDRTYVAERNLEPDESDEPINHPEIYDFFSGLVEGSYLPKSIN